VGLFLGATSNWTNFALPRFSRTRPQSLHSLALGPSGSTRSLNT
jgi:hypothetical protein